MEDSLLLLDDKRRHFEVSGTCQLSRDHVSVEGKGAVPSSSRLPPAYLPHLHSISAARPDGIDTGPYKKKLSRIVAVRT